MTPRHLLRAQARLSGQQPERASTADSESRVNSKTDNPDRESLLTQSGSLAKVFPNSAKLRTRL